MRSYDYGHAQTEYTPPHTHTHNVRGITLQVPLSCVLGVTGQRDAAEKAKRGSADDGGDVCCRGTAAAAFTKRAGGGHAASSRSYPKSGGGGVGGGVGQGMGGGAYDAWSRLTLRAQVFHREEVKHRGGWGRGTRGGGGEGGDTALRQRAATSNQHYVALGFIAHDVSRVSFVSPIPLLLLSFRNIKAQRGGVMEK